MRQFKLSRTVAWGIILILVLMVGMPGRELPAEEVGCIAVDSNDMPRACTFLEEHGACLWYALDSYDSCKVGADGLLERTLCEIGVQVDLLACNFELPWRLIDSVFS